MFRAKSNLLIGYYEFVIYTLKVIIQYTTEIGLQCCATVCLTHRCTLIGAVGRIPSGRGSLSNGSPPDGYQLHQRGIMAQDMLTSSPHPRIQVTAADVPVSCP